MPSYETLVQPKQFKGELVRRIETASSTSEIEKRYGERREALLSAAAVQVAKSKLKFKTRDKLQFFMELSNTVLMGAPIAETMREFAESMDDKGAVGVCSKMAQDSLAGVGLVKSLQSIPSAFTPTEMGLVEAFSLVDRTQEGLLRCHQLLDRADRITRVVKKTAIYPSIVAIMGVVFVVFLAKGPLPQLRSVYDGHKMPFMFEMVCKVVDATINNGLFMVGFMIFGLPVLLFLFRRWLRQPSAHRVLLKLPKIGSLVRTYVTTNFLRTYAALTDAQLPEPEKQRMCRSLSPLIPYMECFAWGMVKSAQGSNVYDVLNAYPDLFGRRLLGVFKRGSKGDLVASLNTFLSVMERDLDDAVDQFKEMATPIALLVVLPPILFIIIGVFSGVTGMLSVY